MAGQLFQRGKVWYLRYTDADGHRTMKRLATDKRVAEQLARKIEDEQDRIRGGWIEPKDMAYRDHAARPLSEHLADWHADLLAKGKTPKHADLSRARAGKLAAMITGVSLDKLVPGRKADAMERAARLLADTLGRARFGDLSPEAIQAALARIRDDGRSSQTANHFRAAIRAFLKWCHKRGRIRNVASDGVEAFNVDEDLRHVRRSLTHDELGRLIHHAETARTVLGMPGPLRAMAYRTAASTGFRVDELRSLTPEAFHLDGRRPLIALTAGDAKNRKAVNQPIPAALVGPLRAWLQDKPAGESVFPLHHDTGKAIKADLRACGIPYETEDGMADFHALRAYYVSALIQAGASISEVQKLARHAKPETTLKHYAKVARHDLHGAVESLPNLSPAAPGPRDESMVATGTYATNVDTLGPILVPSGVVSGRDQSASDVMTLLDVPESLSEKTPEKKPSDASSRVQTACVSGEGGIRTPGTGFPVQRFSKPSLSTTQPPLQAGGDGPGVPPDRRVFPKNYQTMAPVVNRAGRATRSTAPPCPPPWGLFPNGDWHLEDSEPVPVWKQPSTGLPSPRG
jgi:integrase